MGARAVGSVLITIVVACTPGPVPPQAGPPSTAAPSPNPGHPFDPYLGFGISDVASLRDETIANHEWFREEVEIARCMERKGFRYWPAPWGFEGYGDLDHIAADLGVTAHPEASEGESRNTRYAKRLPPPDRDRYYRALYGESLKDIEASGGHGEVPAGRDPETFLRGGCAGRAEREAPATIWDRGRRLERLYDRLRNRMRKDGATEVEVEEAFVDRYRVELEAIGDAYPGIRTYEDVLAKLRADQRFMRWLTSGRV